MGEKYSPLCYEPSDGSLVVRKDAPHPLQVAALKFGLLGQDPSLDLQGAMAVAKRCTADDLANYGSRIPNAKNLGFTPN